MNKLISLLAEKAKIEGKIRQHRVVTIRRSFAAQKDHDKVTKQLIEEMERRLASVVYSQSEFDDLLDQIEADLGLS